MSDERRKLRTTHLRPAAELLLKSVAEAHGLALAAVSDHFGLFMAGHGDEAACRVLAENSALLYDPDAEGRDEALEALEAVYPGAGSLLTVHRFEAEGEALFFAAVGQTRAPGEGSLAHATQGIRRILAESTGV